MGNKVVSQATKDKLAHDLGLETKLTMEIGRMLQRVKLEQWYAKLSNVVNTRWLKKQEKMN